MDTMDRDTLDTVSADYLFSSNLAADTGSSSQGGTMQRIGPSPVCILRWWEGWGCTVWLQLAAVPLLGAHLQGGEEVSLKGQNSGH